MKIFTLFTLFLFPAFNLFSQAKHDYVWLFGSTSIPGNPEKGGSIIDFNPGSGAVYEVTLPVNFRETNASICDENGQLLFYTNGCSVINSVHEVMDNGQGLNPGDAHDEYCEDGYPIIGGALILPAPDSSDIYYLFHLGEYLDLEEVAWVADKLYYSKIDLSKNNGLGKVVEKNKLILQDAFHKGDLTAVRHANNIDWWVIQPRKSSNTYFKILLTANGIDTVIAQEIGLSTLLSGSGQAAFSPDGNYFARYNGIDHVLLFHFDRATGELSDFNQLFMEEPLWIGGVTFSPNSRYLYVTTHTNAFQFDLEAQDVQQSKTLIASWDGFTVYNFNATTFNRMVLGPDCKIYIGVYSYTPYLHIIHNPDMPGLACNFEQRAIELPWFNYHSMPNFPNYRLGTPYPVCDSNLVITAIPDFAVDFSEPIIFPNPATEKTTLYFSPPPGKNCRLLLTNLTGRLLQQFTLPGKEISHSINLAGMPSGLYFLILSIDGEVKWSGKLVKN